VRPVLEEAAMLTELSMVEQRYLAVREALDSGATIVQVAAQCGVDRRTLHRWLTRVEVLEEVYEGDGELDSRAPAPFETPDPQSMCGSARLMTFRRAPREV